MKNNTTQNKVCATQGCTRKIQARGLCSTCYSRQWRSNNHVTYECDQCSKSFKKDRKKSGERVFCSTKCQLIWLNSNMQEEQQDARRRNRLTAKPDTACIKCGRQFKRLNSKHRYCSSQCYSEHNKKPAVELRSKLRRGIEEQDPSLVLEYIEEKSHKSHNGCWEWPRVDSEGYARTAVAGKYLAVHRVSLEANMGKPLGSQAAHHKCSNRCCVNPQHLQPVTHVDNTVEMLQRKSYVARIRELESALGKLHPDHPLLDEIAVQ